MKTFTTLNHGQVKLLYWGWDIDTFTSDPPHRHPFWQIEIVASGTITTTLNGVPRLLEASSIFVIPPENLHDFKKKKSAPGSLFSFKFEIDGLPPDLPSIIISANDFSKYISNTLTNLLQGNEKNRLLSSDKQIALEYLLRGIVHYCFIHKPHAIVQDSPLVCELYKLIHYQGKSVNVESAAETLKCSTSFLKRYIKKEKGIPVKKFIDRECVKIIQQYLEYSTFNLTKIAEIMNFPDIYAFSRFFKRLCNMTPTQYRKLHVL